MATVASPELSFFRPASRINPWIHDGADQKSRSIWNGNNGAVSAQRMRYEHSATTVFYCKITEITKRVTILSNNVWDLSVISHFL